MLPYLLLLVALIAVSGGVLFLTVRALRRPDPAQERLERILEEIGLSVPVAEQAPKKAEQPFVLQPALTSAGELVLKRLMPGRHLEPIRQDLERAGQPFGGGVAEYFGLRLALALSMSALGALVARGRPPGTILAILFGCAVLGWGLPAYWLQSRIRAWQQAVWSDFPDSLDLLALCIGAGQGLEAAIGRVSREWPGAMADEYQRVLSEIRLGASRREALLAMARRIDIPEVASFISVVVQADRVGGAISDLMLEQAEQVRTARRQRAEELARQAGTKMLFPLVFCMFPALMTVLLGPAVPQLLETLGNL